MVLHPILSMCIHVGISVFGWVVLRFLTVSDYFSDLT